MHREERGRAFVVVGPTAQAQRIRASISSSSVSYTGSGTSEPRLKLARVSGVSLASSSSISSILVTSSVLMVALRAVGPSGPMLNLLWQGEVVDDRRRRSGVQGLAPDASRRSMAFLSDFLRTSP